MKIDICALFPSIFENYLKQGVVEHAIDEHLLAIDTHCFRDYDLDGLGPTIHGSMGKLLRTRPVVACVDHVQRQGAAPGHLVMLTPHGRPFCQEVAAELANHNHLTLLCGRFGGFEQTVHNHLVVDEISVGDFVLTGGEVAAMVILDAVLRLVPGILGSPDGTPLSRRALFVG